MPHGVAHRRALALSARRAVRLPLQEFAVGSYLHYWGKSARKAKLSNVFILVAFYSKKKRDYALKSGSPRF